MSIRKIIADKRDGRELSSDDIARAVQSYVKGDMSEGQMGALLMAIVLRGMTVAETTALTMEMVESGQRLDLTGIPGTKVDKHSTGGVGDKTTLVVAPLVASFGIPVPKMSGRALGHTGGTIDKLECIQGLTTQLSPDRFRAQIRDIGVAIAVQTDAMVPADKRIYTLRDSTATVESIPLIASSIMSKKLAVGADAIVLDVKFGRGAFMQDLASSQALARAMVEVGFQAGKKTVALVTRMEEPLGEAVGDGPELVEAIETLKGGCGGRSDFVELCEIVAGHMLTLGGKTESPKQGRKLARQGLDSGAGLAKFRELILAQGGDDSILGDPEMILRNAIRTPVESPNSGYITEIDAKRIGTISRDLKATWGESHRRQLCGVWLRIKVGEKVSKGEPLAHIISPPQPTVSASIVQAVQKAFQIGEQFQQFSPVLAEIIEH